MTASRNSRDLSPKWRLAKQVLVLVALYTQHLSGSARSEVDDVVARVNAETIRKSFYEGRREYLEKQLRRKFAGKKLEDELARQGRDLLKTLIEDLVLRQKAQELGILPEMEIVNLDRTRREDSKVQERLRTALAAPLQARLREVFEREFATSKNR